MLEDLLNDLRHAARLLARSPAFAVTAVLSLAVGIGASTAMYGLVHTVLLRSLPVDRPHDLVFLQTTGLDGRGGAPPYPWFERIRNEGAAFDGIAAFAADELRVEIDGAIEQVFGQVASGNYFEVLGVRPAAGRLLAPGDERLEPAVAVIGYGYWQRRFGGDAAAIGRTIAIGDRSYTIVGITPAPFWGLYPGRQVEVTVPITTAREMMANSAAWGWFEAVARLKPGASVEQATAQADTVLRSFLETRRSAPDASPRHLNARVRLAPASQGLDRLRSRFQRPLYALTAAAGIVLLVVCVNIGSLLVARGSSRSREFATRLAVGAGATRLLRQLLAETLLLFALGAAGGLFVGRVLADAVSAFVAVGRNPIVLDVQYDWRLAAFAVAVALASGLTTGLWPALHAMRVDPHAATKDGNARSGGSPRSPAAGRILVVSQVALSLVLVVSAVLFLRTMANLRRVDLGFAPQGVLTMSLSPAFPDGDAADARVQFWTQVLARVRALPGVRAASLSVLTPLSGRDTGRAVATPFFHPRDERDGMARVNHVSEDYFRTFGIDLLAGRVFTPRDIGSAVKVALVNDAAARHYFPGRSAIGETLRLGDAAYQVVGVVRNHKHRSVREEGPRFVFIPIWQPLDSLGRLTLSVAGDQRPSTMARTVANEVRGIYWNTLVSDVVDTRQQIDQALLTERLLSLLAAAFAIVAVGLAAIGLYGVLSCSVAHRRIELGIRVALGAGRSRIAWTVLLDVLVQVTAGFALGVPIALAAARMAEGLLFGVSSGDPAVYATAAGTIVIVAAAAAAPPVWRACSIDPVEVVRG